MKKQILLFAGLFILSLGTFAQNTMNLVVFAEDGDLFFAYVNGIRQNDSPQANVKITGLTSPNLSLRIEFNDKALPQLKQNMALEMGYEHTAKIKRDTKKQIKLRYFGQAPLNSTPSDANTVSYHTSETPAYNVAPTAGSENNTSASTTVTSTQTYNTGNPGSVDINMSGVGISMNVTGMDPNAVTMKTTSSTTVTSSNYSSGSSSSGFENTEKSPAASPSSSGSGCSTAMGASDFGKMKSSVESKPFSDTKMSTAKIATKNACLSVNQVKEICKLFNMDEEKLTYAKYAYDRCVDKANFYQVGEVFSFSSTNDDLNKFLEQN